MTQRRIVFYASLCVTVSLIGVASGLVWLSSYSVSPLRNIQDVLDRFGPPLAIADSAKIGTVARTRSLFHNAELMLTGIRQFEYGESKRANSSVIWIYSEDLLVIQHIVSVLSGQFSAVKSPMPFRLPDRFTARVIEISESGDVVRNELVSAYTLVLQRGGFK